MLTRIILGAAVLAGAALAQQNNNQQNNNQGNNNQANNQGNNQGNNQQGDATQLLANAIQSGSFLDGTDALGASDEQVASETSENNFINFCAGQTLTNGLQITTGSCNGIRKLCARPTFDIYG